MRVAVDDEQPRAGEGDKRDVAFLVHVLGLTLAVAPHEQRRVQVLAGRAPRRAAPVEREEVDDIHPASVEEPSSCA